MVREVTQAPAVDAALPTADPNLVAALKKDSEADLLMEVKE